MYMVRRANDTIGYDFYFIVLIFIGNFFALNLIIAVQFTSIGEIYKLER